FGFPERSDVLDHEKNTDYGNVILDLWNTVDPQNPTGRGLCRLWVDFKLAPLPSAGATDLFHKAPKNLRARARERFVHGLGERQIASIFANTHQGERSVGPFRPAT